MANKIIKRDYLNYSPFIFERMNLYFNFIG